MGALLDWLLGPADVDDEVKELDESEEGDLTEDGHPFDLQCGCGECVEEWRCAVHEAGHVIAADARGWPWEYVTVRGDAPHVEMVNDSDDFDDPGDIWDHLVIFHAGHAAEHAVFGRFAGSTSDLAELPKLADRHPSPTAQDDAWVDAEEVIGDNLDELREFAEELFYEGTIFA